MKKEIDEQVFNLMDALRSPILTHSQSWADCIPQRITQLIPMARMVNLITQVNTATDVEVVVFVMTATMEFPMHGEWVDIYTHLSCKVLQEHFQEDHWDEIKAPRELTNYMITQFLNPLRRHIWEKRRKILKQRLKSEKAIENVTQEMETIPQIEQLQFQF